MAYHSDAEALHSRIGSYRRNVDCRGLRVVRRCAPPAEKVAERPVGLRLSRGVQEASAVEMIRNRPIIVSVACGHAAALLLNGSD